MMKNAFNLTTNAWNNSNIGLQLSHSYQSEKKTLGCHLNFWKCTPAVKYLSVLWVAAWSFSENKMACRTYCLNLDILPCSFVMQYQILMKDHYICCLHAEFVPKYAKALLCYCSHHSERRSTWGKPATSTPLGSDWCCWLSLLRVIEVWPVCAQTLGDKLTLSPAITLNQDQFFILDTFCVFCKLTI